VRGGYTEAGQDEEGSCVTCFHHPRVEQDIKIARNEKNDERWVVMMAKQDTKIELEKERVTVKKRKKDFLLLIADTSMDVETKEWYLGEREAILQRGRTQAPPTLEPTPTPMPRLHQ
jgi:hypothetical protein